MRDNTAFCNTENKGEIINEREQEGEGGESKAMIKWSKAGGVSLHVTAKHTHLPTSES